MYEFMSVVKFNGQYFEHGDEVVITKNDNSIIVGSIVIKGDDGNRTNHWHLCLDTSEKYHKKTDMIMESNIKSIQKIYE